MQPALYFPPNIEHNSPLQILHKNQIQIQVIALFPVNTVFVPEEEKKLVAGSVLENVIPTEHDFQNFETHPLIAVCRF